MKRVPKDASALAKNREAKGLTEAYSTSLGRMFQGRAENAMELADALGIVGETQLIFTSPPFPLNRKKKYGNYKGDEYLIWLASLAPVFKKLLSPTGSIVIELGNAWEPGKPVMSTLGLRALLQFLEAGELNLCQQFICHNPARLPSPVQWVNKERIRVKDSFTHVWWMSPSERPKANNRRVLKPYSNSMQQLLASQKYNAGRRPSQHTIGSSSFLKSHEGAIPPNVLTIPNTSSNSPYQEYCQREGIPTHPARMQPGLPEFFINFLTDPEDLVLDPFGGSNTTGAVAEALNRRWVSIEPEDVYIRGSRGWFPELTAPETLEILQV